jgi:hypothetical protein
MAYLVKSIAQVKEHVNVGNGLTISTLRPALNEVQMQELTYYLGTDILDLLMSDLIQPRMIALLPYALAANVGLAIFKAGPELEVIVSDNGILRQESANEKTAFGGQVKRFRDMAADRGWKALDSLLGLIQSDIETYPEWTSSEYYQSARGLLIGSSIEFERSGESIKGSALTYQALKPIIREVQETRIRDIFPEDMFLDLMDNPSTPDNSFLLERYVRPAIAKFTLEEALTSLPVDIDHESVTVNQIALAGDARTMTQAPIHLLEKKTWAIRGKGDYYISRMKEYLNANASDEKYALWFGSEYFSETLKARILKYSLNDDDRKIYRS